MWKGLRNKFQQHTGEDLLHITTMESIGGCLKTLDIRKALQGICGGAGIAVTPSTTSPVEGQGPSQKIYNDMKSVCDFIDLLAKEKGVDCCGEALSETQCFEIFDRAATEDNGLIAKKNRKAHTQWRTAIRKIQKIKRNQSAAMAPETEQPTAPAATALVANRAPTPTVRPNRIRGASGRPPSGRRPKRHRETVVL